MNTEPVEELLPDLATEQQTGTDISTVAIPATAIDEVVPSIEEISTTGEIAADIPSSPSGIILSIKVNGENFLDWALESSISFLDLADLQPLETVDRLRGIKEPQIRDKIQMANSILVLLANYASENDNAELVEACSIYALKMKTIIKRLCL